MSWAGFALMGLCVLLSQHVSDKWGVFWLSFGGVLGFAIMLGG